MSSKLLEWAEEWTLRSAVAAAGYPPLRMQMEGGSLAAERVHIHSTRAWLRHTSHDQIASAPAGLTSRRDSGPGVSSLFPAGLLAFAGRSLLNRSASFRRKRWISDSYAPARQKGSRC